MKKTLIIAVFFAAAFAFSCQQKEIVETPDVSGEPVVRTFTCEFAQPDTKIAVVNDGKTTWEEGDEILIHSGTDGNERTIVTLTAADISDGGKKATITVAGLNPYVHSSGNYTSTFYAIYPASAVKSSANLYYETRIEEYSKPAVGACDDGEGKFLFYNLGALISYQVSGDFDSCELSGNNGEIISYVYYQCRIAKKSDGNMYIDWFKYGNGISSDEAGPLTKQTYDVVSDGSTTNYICIPRGVNFVGGFTMKFMKDGEIKKIASTNTAVSIERGQLLPLGTLTNLKDYVPPTTDSHTSAITGATDLSAGNGPANCYIISAPGAYKLPVVKGNNAELSAGSIFGAKLVWESYNNAEEVNLNSIIANVDYDGPENYLYFETPSALTPGNAVIAALDANEKIIWSWHIWIPKTSISVIDGGIHTTPLMSRNLGALIDAEASSTVTNDVTSAGLFYQWGRKDPFPGPSTFEEDYPAGAKVAGTAKTISEGPISLVESIQNPTLYGLNNGDWCTDHNAEYWGDNGSKTIYDPCPAGYRIPKRDQTKNLWNGEDDTFMAFAGWAYDGDHKWFTLGDPVVVFPLTGYMDSGTYNRCKAGRTVIWNAHADGDNNAYNRYIYNGPRAVRYSHNKSRGYSVRCCVE